MKSQALNEYTYDVFNYEPELDYTIAPFQRLARRIYSMKLIYGLGDKAIVLDWERLKDIADNTGKRMTHEEGSLIFTAYSKLKSRLNE